MHFHNRTAVQLVKMLFRRKENISISYSFFWSERASERASTVLTGFLFPHRESKYRIKNLIVRNVNVLDDA